MSIDDERDLAGMRAAGRVVARAIREMRAQVRPGVSTAELDGVAGRVFAAAGARSGPQLDYGFPGITCISVNDEAVHGIPGRRRLRDGDLVKLDVTAERDGFYADACVSVAVGAVRPARMRLVATAHAALAQAMAVARPGTPINHVGRAVAAVVEGRGHSICPELAGHGIGHRIHEWPDVPNYDDPAWGEPLTEGLVITIEPIICAGSGALAQDADGWTIRTADGACSAHVEHTLVITDGAPLVLTA